MRCRVELFGGPVVRLGSRSLDKFETRKTALLLGVLASDPGRSWNRNALCEVLWPFEDPAISRTRLRQAAAALRRSFGECGDLIVADRVDLKLDGADVDSDVAEFERLLKRAQNAPEPGGRATSLAQAVALVGEVFLPGFTEEWAVARREHYRAATIEAMHAAVEAFAEAGMTREAIESAGLLLRSDPLNEPAARLLMRLYADEGMAPNAMKVYRDLAGALHVQIGLAPSQETDALLEEIRRHSPIAKPVQAPVAPSAGAAPVLAVPRLPEPPTALFGRESQVESLAQLLDAEAPKARVVTLTGIGGIGKTRLALEVGRRLRDDYGGLAWMVPLETLDDGAALPQVVMDSSGFARVGSGDARDQLVDRIGESRALLILDNFEQIVDDGALHVSNLVARCPNLRVLVTSRVALAISAEREFPLHPLGANPDDAEQAPSVQMFLDRARATRPDFEYGPEVAELCGRLEGIPLAIALAASRAGVLSVAEMIREVDHRFELLSTRLRDLPERHRTMRAAIDWSVASLSPSTREVFAMLSIFRGGWDLEAARAIAPQAPDALSALEELRERSLVVTDDTPGGTRFRMLETIREYASECVPDDERHDLSLRHAEFFASRTEALDQGMRGAGQKEALAKLDLDRPNALAALDWACEDQPDLAARLLGAFWMYWHIRGRFHEGRDWGLRVVAAFPPDSKSVAYSKALNGLGVMYDRCDEHGKSVVALTKAVDLAEEAGDLDRLSDALNNLGNVEFSRGNYEESRRRFEQALAINQNRGSARYCAMILANMGNVSCAQCDFGAAQAYLTSALESNRTSGNRHWEANNLTSLGIVALFRSDVDLAESLLRESLVMKREIGHPGGIRVTLNYLVRLECRRGRFGEAIELLRESARLIPPLEAPGSFSDLLTGGVIAAMGTGRLHEAAVFIGIREELRESYNLPNHPLDRDSDRERCHEVEIALGEAYGPAFAIGRRLAPEQIIPQIDLLASEVPQE